MATNGALPLIDDLLASDLHDLSDRARRIRSECPGPNVITFSPKVFLPITRLCRDSCSYCTFAHPPKQGPVYMTVEECVTVALEGRALGCSEALITLGDKPELKWQEARDELAALGFDSTLDLVSHIAAQVMERTGLIPHINAGTMTEEQATRLKRVSASQGLMLESGSDRLFYDKTLDGPHPGGLEGCPDKEPSLRMATLRAAGRARVPYTTGILIGIGETRAERLSDLMAINDIHNEFGHIQEVIIQPFRAKTGTPMANHPEPSLEDLLWTISAARVILDPSINLQAPPNLTATSSSASGTSEGDWRALIDAGINDFGGISPVTRDWVNPEKPWPHLQQLGAVCAEAGFDLIPRLPIYPAYVPLVGSMAGFNEGKTPGWIYRPSDRNLDHPKSIFAAVLAHSDSSGFARGGDGWFAGLPSPAEPSHSFGSVLPPRPNQFTLPTSRQRWSVSVGSSGTLAGLPSGVPTAKLSSTRGRKIKDLIARVLDGPSASPHLLSLEDVELLLTARGAEFHAIVDAADLLRSRVNGDTVSFVVNRNINYTNICTLSCSFCAFSKGKASEDLRGASYLLPLDEISKRTKEAYDRGATEVCLQGGIHPSFDGNTYLSILRAAREGAPVHVHAFSPLEVHHGATTLNLPLAQYLVMLRDNGLGSLPGTAAEVLDDDVRDVICPDKINSDRWIEVLEAAHSVGLKTTSTLMFGHVEGTTTWARHLIKLRDLQQKTGGISEFVPLPFVHMMAPIFVKQGAARRGPTLHESILLHAVSRLALHPYITNIQASWVKMGPDRAADLLSAGCNDMGGLLMDESITRAAGAAHGQEVDYERMLGLIRGAGREPRVRTTLYGDAPPGQVAKATEAGRVRPLRI